MKVCYQKFLSLVLTFFLYYILLGDFCGYAASQDAASLTLRRLYEKMEQELHLSLEQIKIFTKEIEVAKTDQKTLTAVIIRANNEEKKIKESLAQSEKQLKILFVQHEEIFKKFLKNRKEFIKIAAILERMSIIPIEQFLFAREDALQTVRAASLLGSILPKLQKKLAQFAILLKNLKETKQEIESQQISFRQQAKEQYLIREKLKLLLKEKAKAQQISQAYLAQQEKENAALIKKAKDFSAFLKAINQETSERKERILHHLERNISFEQLKQSLPCPISGKVIAYYNREKNPAFEGEAIQSLPHAVVTAPLDALVVYAGPFRSYGKLVILDVGNAYHILLAGLKSINIIQGKFVLKGEIIGKMGAKASAFPLQLLGDSLQKNVKNKYNPILYIEFRKNGQTVNPRRWWRPF